MRSHRPARQHVRLFGRARLAPEPVEIPEDRTEHEEARRVVRDWLRDRSEDDAIDFEDPETC